MRLARFLAYWLGVVFLLAAPALHANQSEPLPNALSKLSRFIAEHPAVSLAFEQQQKLPLLNQPLQSNGEIVVVNNRGLLWSVHSPFPETQIISTDEALNSLGDKNNKGGFALVSKLLLALFSADLGTLNQYFDHSILAESDGWNLVLNPKEKWLAEHIQQIDLQGSEQLQRVVIQYPDNIVSTLNIMRISALNAVPEQFQVP